mgnify:CR=1 FL=1
MSNIDMNKNSENGSSNYTGDDKFVIDASACISCGTCEGVCPVGAPCEE